MSLNVPDEREKVLIPKQQQAILLLAKGSTIIDAAHSAHRIFRTFSTL
jgi:hypothetical protein